MKAFKLFLFSLALMGGAALASGGTSVWGDEAREVYDTLIAAGATRTDIPEGPTVIIDEVRCEGQNTEGALVSASCRLSGDPKLNMLTGPMGLRLMKALIAMGVRQRTTENSMVTIAVSGLDCGVLHNFNEDGQPSCFFVDNN